MSCIYTLSFYWVVTCNCCCVWSLLIHSKLPSIHNNCGTKICEWVRAAVTFDYCSLSIGGFTLCLTGSKRMCPSTLHELHNAYEARLNYLDLQILDLVFITWNWIFCLTKGFYSNSFYREFVLTGFRSTGISFQWEFVPVGLSPKLYVEVTMVRVHWNFGYWILHSMNDLLT